MGKPASAKDLDQLKAAQAAMAGAQAWDKLGSQSASRFGNSLQFPNSEGSSSAAMDKDRKNQTEEETTLGELRRKYGIR